MWWYFSTSQGWNSFLSDVAHVSNGNEVIGVGDTVEFIIGELKNKANCLECQPPYLIKMEDHFSALLPNGSLWNYELVTTYQLEEYENLTKVTVFVEKYTDDEAMQWVRECGSTGWKQTLFNLKCIIELGLDLRNDIFNYPRLGVLNYTATEEQLNNQNLLSKTKGNFIKKVYPNSPAHSAGLKDGDIIVTIAGEDVPTYDHFVKILSSYYKKNTEVDVIFFRDGEELLTKVHLTYDDQFTGMIDPKTISLEEVSRIRKMKS
ncbi:PDZ domain-containing protein [Cytobacillus oceanisediminis]|uniref:PDZ domain-containing protein n=1 Tax=Cytobacillus oceanisediminis TaxID=665099 RepID=UPI0028166A68|nr:PDZ domain-containing protein [Cytobacillus oceanisediminis]